MLHLTLDSLQEIAPRSVTIRSGKYENQNSAKIARVGSAHSLHFLYFTATIRSGKSENHISETLSQFLHTKFFQFVNGFRVEEAKKALQDKDKLITRIAFDVGFNSKSTFNTAFKKVVGYSPSAYRNLLLENKQTIL